MTPPPAGAPRQIEAGPGVWVATAGAPWDTLLARYATGADRTDVRRPAHRRHTERLRARGLLRTLLGSHFPAVADVGIGYARSGRPVLVGQARLGISLSHADGVYAACVALDRTVGVDVQPPPADLSDPVLRWCAPARRHALAALPPEARAREFAWMWTVKEACGKALGTGLAGPALTLDVPPGANSGSWGRYRWVSLRQQSSIPLSCAFSSVVERGTPQ
ncbi:4'-phosphopantetheinyl transferase superfamily protein [Streptomyces sp. NPDC002132]|uniref:4'-phosphopantetheinyl transferase family protein n=1 Tax=unclassified Streptomyces TaxID=2593676 RepID=UPI00333109AA